MTSRAMAQILDKVSARAPHAASDGPRNFRAMPRPSALCAGGVALASLPQTSAAPLLFAANTKAVVPYACRCEALDYCDPLDQR